MKFLMLVIMLFYFNFILSNVKVTGGRGGDVGSQEYSEMKGDYSGDYECLRAMIGKFQLKCGSNTTKLEEAVHIARC